MVEVHGATWRAAGADDVDKMAAIEQGDASHGRWDRASFVQELQCTWSHTWVMQAEDGALAGFLVAWRVADESHLLNIAVDPAWRRRGVGRAMLGHLRTWSVALGLTRILLELRAGNGAALRLYESCGFVTQGRRAAYYEKTGEDAVLMACEL